MNFLLRTSFPFLLAIFFMGCADIVRNTPQSETPLDETNLSSGKHWERIFFPIVRERLVGTGVEGLNRSGGSSDEIRIWTGFSHNGIQGLLLKKNTTTWNGVYLGLKMVEAKSGPKPRTVEPRSGWPALFERLNDLNLYTLPDATDIGANNSYPDAEAIIIEYKRDGTYRTYMYNGFYEIKSPETKKVLDICALLQSEFELEMFCPFESGIQK